MSYKSLCVRTAMSNSSEDFFTRASSSTSPSTAASRLTPSEKSGSFRERRKPAAFLDVPGPALFRRGRHGGPALYTAVSDTQIPTSTSCSVSDPRSTLHQSFSGLETDYKSAEWDRRFFQIQQEMDACLLEREREEQGGEEGGGGAVGVGGGVSSGTEDRVGFCAGGAEGVEPRATRGSSKKKTANPHSKAIPNNLMLARWVPKNPRARRKALSRSAPNTPEPRPKMNHQPVNTSDTSDNEPDTSGSSNSDVITIRLHPPSSPHQGDSGQEQHSASEDLTETSVLRSVVVSSEADNTQDDSDVLNTNDDSPASEYPRERLGSKRGGKHKHKRLLKARFRNTLRASTRPMLKHLLSKKTASNERKASKVSGKGG